MAFEVAQDREAPQFTTVANYSLNRLGIHPGLRAGFQETVWDRETVTIDAAEQVSGEGNFVRLTIPQFANYAGTLVGREVFQDTTSLGVITAVEDAEQGIVTVSVGAAAAPSGAAQVQRTNAFGIPVQRGARGGRVYEVYLSPVDAAQTAYMGQMLGTVMAKAALAVLAALGDSSHTPDAVAAAVQALAQQGTNIDTIIAEEVENLEKARRAGTIRLDTMGAAPDVAA